MPGISYTIARKRVRVVEEAVDQWQIEHGTAMLACDIEDLVFATADLIEPVERVANFIQHGPSAHGGTDQFVQPHMIGSLVEKALALFEKMAGLVADSERLEFEITGLDRFRDSRQRIELIRDRLSRQWMLPDRDRVRAALAEFAAGEYRVLEGT